MSALIATLATSLLSIGAWTGWNTPGEGGHGGGWWGWGDVLHCDFAWLDEELEDTSVGLVLLATTSALWLESDSYSLAIESINHAIGSLPRLKNNLSNNHRARRQQTSLQHLRTNRSHRTLNIRGRRSRRKVLCLNDTWPRNSLDRESALVALDNVDLGVENWN